MKSKRIAVAVLTAGILTMSMCAPVGLTAFAGESDTYKITISETNTEYDYVAYQIFAGEIAEKNNEKILSDIKWAAGVDSVNLVKELAESSVLKTGTAQDFSETMTAEAVAEKLKTYDGNDTKLAEFAKLAKANVSSTSGFKSDDKNVISVTGSGYYLIEETAVPAGSPAGTEEVYSRYMLDVVGNTTVTPKRSLPELTKKIISSAKDGGKANTASIGDTIKFQIDSAMPDRTGYNAYYFVINDTLSDGLSFDEDSVVVTIGGSTLTDGYEVQTGDDADGHTFQIVFTDFIDRTEAKDTAIVVTYEAVLNENADRTTAGNTNTADLTYSNNPNHEYDTDKDEPGKDDPTGNTPDQQTKTYTANIKLTKIDENNNALTGAKFQIAGTSAKCVLINGDAYVADAANGTYYKLKDGTFTTTAPTTATEDSYDGTTAYSKVENVDADTSFDNICMEAYVKADGTLEFGGLGAGTYTITELVAPDGYNKLSEPIVITISDEGTTFGAPKWSATGAEMAANSATATLEVVNKIGSILPSTGGIGTKLFFIVGSVMAIGSGIYLVTKKRMSDVEQ